MLPSQWRLQVKNETGTSIDVEVKVQGFDLDSSSLEPAYGSWSGDLGTTGLADGAVHSTAEQDNSADGFLGATVEIVVSNFGATPSGDVIVYFQRRGDGASDWPDDEEGFPVIVENFTATGTYRRTSEV